MNDNSGAAITDARLLAAMQAVNPPLEKLMEDRLALRIENRETRQQLANALSTSSERQAMWDGRTVHYIAAIKQITLGIACLLVFALAIALFTHLLSVTLIAALLSSLILPLWMVETAEQRLRGGKRIALIGRKSEC